MIVSGNVATSSARSTIASVYQSREFHEAGFHQISESLLAIASPKSSRMKGVPVVLTDALPLGSIQ